MQPHHHRRACSSVVTRRTTLPRPHVLIPSLSARMPGSCFIRRNTDRPGFREYFDSQWRSNIVCVTRTYPRDGRSRVRRWVTNPSRNNVGCAETENRLETVYGPFIISCVFTGERVRGI
jgi:signal-transduction protein with cAMP-binding, CBS, and nucleotidyltransferase domain